MEDRYVYLVTLSWDFDENAEFNEGVFPTRELAEQYVNDNPAPANYHYNIYAVRSFLE